MKCTQPSAESPVKKISWIALFILGFIIIIIAFLYFDRRNQITEIIQSLGFFGIAFAVLLMVALCMTPIPSEGLVVLYLKIFGIVGGTLISWLGASLSSLVIFVLARHYGQRFLQKFVAPERFNVVDNWVKRKGTAGLFIARLLPIPAFAVNYIAGVIPSVRLWPYLWTSALAIIPYYVATALVFLGFSQEIWLWLIIGCIVIMAFWAISFTLKRHKII